MIKMIALDLDGTLLTSQKTIDQETIKRLLEVQKRGIMITIATGRDKGGIDFVIQALQLKQGHNYIAGINGQIIYDFQQKEYFVDEVFHERDAHHILQLAKRMNFEVVCCCGYDHYDYARKGLRLKKKMRNLVYGEPLDYGFKQGKRQFIPIQRTDYTITQDINKFVIIQTEDYFKKHLSFIKAELKAYDILSVGPAWIEVMPKGVSKGSAIRRIAKQNHLEMDEIMAFGDAENDISMMQTVGRGIAMGNAMECIKRYAWALTDTNDQMGIAKALDRYVL